MLLERKVLNFFPGNFEKQFRFFTVIDDRARLLECHGAMMEASESWLFFEDDIRQNRQETFRHKQGAPELLHQLGHRDLALALFQKYYQGLPDLDAKSVPFVEAYVDFLISLERFDEAKSVSVEALGRNIGFDLRKIVTLYQKWGKMEGLESETGLFGLTSSQESQLIGWRDALREGREMALAW